MGKEETTVFRILQAFVNWSTVSPPVRSAIARNCHPGRIFVEAASFNTANSVARQFDVLNKSDVRVLPLEEAHLCLSSGIRFTPSPDSWIRIRKGRYRGDIAYIRRVDSRSLHIDVIVVPRITYDQGRKRKLGIRPQPQLLNAHDVQTKLGPGKIENRNGRWYFQGQSYTGCGYFLLCDVDTAFYCQKPCFLTAAELNAFRDCKEIPPHIFIATAKQIASRTLRPGDRILIIGGDCIGLSGEICTITEDEADVYLPDQDLLYSLPLRDIQRNFKSGDNVEVVAGIHKGLKGFVMTCFDNVLSLHDPDTKIEVHNSTQLLMTF